MKQFYRDFEVAERCTIGTSTVWAWTKETEEYIKLNGDESIDHLFPLSIKFSPKVTVWDIDDLQRWERCKKSKKQK
jgi:predicted DNA-binding transcriptional regulator AlpA